MPSAILYSMRERLVIVGAGQAAVQAIDTLCRRGYAGAITLVGEEPDLPYQRPPLSKTYLSGAFERSRLLLRPPGFYADRGVETRLGRRVDAIDRAARRVRLDDGSALAYDALLLATGGRARKLPLEGAKLRGVFMLRTADDVDGIREALCGARRLVIAGGGFIGLEVAATVRKLGLDVTVLEMADRVMNRVVCSETSLHFAAEHEKHGVRLVTRARVSEIVGDPEGRVRAVRCDGAEYAADVVLIGAGVTPADELARDAGLLCDNGIAVDEHCRTSDPAIFAAGECTSHPSPRYGRRIRLESVDNAFEQATSAALNLMGMPVVHDKVPWFWSDQYDSKLVIIGLCQGYDLAVTRGDPRSRSFSVCYLQDGELIAVDTVNHPKDQMAARKLVAARVRPDPTKLEDPRRPLAEAVG